MGCHVLCQSKHPQSPICILSFCKRVPANPLPSLLCVHGPSSRPVTTLSGLGMSAAGNPAGEMEEAWTVYEMAGGKVHLPGPELWCTVSLAPHLTCTNSDKPCHLMRPFRKLGKPGVLLTTPASPKKAPETNDRELPWLRPSAFVLGNLHSWLSRWNSLIKGHQQGRQTKGETWCWYFTPALVLAPSLPVRGETPGCKILSSGSDMSCCNSLQHPMSMTPWSLIFMLFAGQSPNHNQDWWKHRYQPRGSSEHPPGISVSCSFIAFGTQIAISWW